MFQLLKYDWMNERSEIQDLKLLMRLRLVILTEYNMTKK